MSWKYIFKVVITTQCQTVELLRLYLQGFFYQCLGGLIIVPWAPVLTHFVW